MYNCKIPCNTSWNKKLQDLSLMLETFPQEPKLLCERNQGVLKELVAMVASHKSSIIVCYYEGDSLIKRFAFSANFKIFFFSPADIICFVKEMS